MPTRRRRPPTDRRAVGTDPGWRGSGAGRALLGLGAVAGGLTLAGLTGAAALRLAGPRPVAWTVRRLTREPRSEHPDVAELQQRVTISPDLEVQVPDGVPAVRFDLYRPAAGGAGPTVVWWHGGGFVGGAKETGHDFGVVLASHGFTVVQPSLALAPDHRYPDQLRQGHALLAHLVEHAVELGVDPALVVLGGEASGATLAAQLLALHTSPALAASLDLAPVLEPGQLCAGVLYCGIYDLFTVADTRFPLLEQMLWGYLGRRDWRRSEHLRSASPQCWLNPDWPQLFVSAGGADPLQPQSVALADRLSELGVAVTRSFHENSRMALQHGFQFAYRTVDGRTELERTVAFLERAVRR